MTEDHGILDGVEHIGEDIVGEVASDLTGLGEVDTFVHGGQALGHLASAAYSEVSGDSESAGHEFGNAVSEGFDAVPFHEAAWDGMMTLGRVIDGPNNNDLMWDQGGEAAFREAWGGTPAPPEEEQPQPFGEVPEA